MKNKLTIEERSRLEDLLLNAKKQENAYIAEITQLALDLDDKGEYYKFEEIFGEHD